MKLLQLTEMSNRYGLDEEYVLAGGGNTSYKEGGVMFVKGSGTSLGTITPEQFVQMDMEKLSGMLKKEYPAADDAREAAALADMMDARLPGEENKRPSVEAVLHAIFPQRFVLHIHPALVNGVSCAKDGEKACRELFGGTAVWVPLTKPGYILASVCRELFDEYEKKNQRYPEIVILENHGLFVAADTSGKIDELTARVMNKLKSRIIEFPDFSKSCVDTEAVRETMEQLKSVYPEDGTAHAIFFTGAQALEQELAAPFTPDHIVYCRHTPLFLEKGGGYSSKFDAYKKAYGFAPRIAFVKGLGFFALGKTEKEAKTAKLLFIDAMKVAVYTRSFGGVNPLPEDFVNFILNWEVENYRQKASF